MRLGGTMLPGNGSPVVGSLTAISRLLTSTRLREIPGALELASAW